MLLTSGALYAVVTSAALRGAGFNAKDGEYNGVKPTAAEKTALNAAIAKLATIPGSADCAKCLDAMCKNGRVCTETGTANKTAGATTLPDKKAGCDPKADGINVNPGSMTAPVEVLACMLAHEWCHTNQTDFSGDFESPCYQAEIDCLKALGQDVAGTPGKARYDQMVQCLADLQKPAQVPPKTEPRNGGAIRYDQGATYSISCSFPNLHGIASDWLTTHDRALMMTIPFDLVLLDHVMGGSQTVAMVSGLHEPSDTGVIQRFVVQDGQVQIELLPMQLVGVHPFRMVRDPARAEVYVLDTQGDQVLRLIDTNGDLVPDQPVPTPFATAGMFPQLASAFGMALNEGAAGPSLFLDDRDTRAFGAVRYGPGDLRTILFDNDSDGQAEAAQTLAWQDHVAMMPGYLSTPLPGATSVHVLAGTGVPVEVQLTDPTGGLNLGTLGNGVVPIGLNEVLVNLSQPLQAGQFIRTLDLDNPSVGSFPLEIVFPAPTSFCRQLKPTSVPGCSATLTASNPTLATGTWNVSNVPLGPASGGTSIGIFIYKDGLGIGQSSFAINVPFGTLCLNPFLRSSPACPPVAIAGGGTNVCHPGFPAFSPTCNGGALGVNVGEDVNVQCWYRDPGAVANANFTNAIFYTVQ